MKVTIYRTLEDLEAVRPQWECLHSLEPFSRWEFARTLLGRRGAKPFVLAATEGDRLVALAPWCIIRDRWGLRRLVGIGELHAWHHDPVWIASAEHCAPHLAAALRQHRRDWDLLDLSLRPSESAPLMRELADLGWLVDQGKGWLAGSVADLSGGWERYWSTRSSSVRSDYRRHLRRLDGKTWKLLRSDASTTERMLEELLTHHAERWGRKDSWPAASALRELCAQALGRGDLHLYGLEIEGSLAALDLTVQAGPWAFGIIRTYKPDFAPYSAGTLLSIMVLEQLAQAGVRWLDFGPGLYPWKERLRSGTTEVTSLLVAPWTKPAALAVTAWPGALKPWLRQSPLIASTGRALLARLRAPALS